MAVKQLQIVLTSRGSRSISNGFGSRGRRAVVQLLVASMITAVLAAVAVLAAARVTAVVDIGVLPKF